MAVSQSELALQMLAQLRVLDPSVSAEVGTPERKILDTVAQALSDSQVDLTQLSGALDIDAKYGSNLDRFLALFGFGRQQAVKATGFITFSRETESTLDIRIPSGSQIMLPPGQIAIDETGHSTDPIYETTFEVTLLAGETSIITPIRAIVAGTVGNLEAGKALQFVGSPVFGITGLVNEAPITGGTDREDDDQLKTRFKNTVFRNLAGTQDQYMALAVSTAFTTKVNVVGPVSRYREYIQVPQSDDSTTGTPIGSTSEYTSALSTVPYSKHTYESIPSFVSNGNTGTQILFYRQDIDWRLNSSGPAKNYGDAYREFTATPPQDVDPASIAAQYRPNISFLNVYNGADSTVQALRRGDIVLFEHSYMSTSSRNNYDLNITNAVDVFIDGINNTVADTVIPTPVGTTAAFVDTATSKYYRQNYRRSGEPDVAPALGNFFLPLFWQPVSALPTEITVTSGVDSSTFYLNEHYWLVEDTTELYGTIRARNGIEWATTGIAAKGATSSNDGSFQNRSGLKLTDFPSGTSVSINSYQFDKNVVDLQSILEAQKQVTTDLLVHRSKKRYFKLDISVMYNQGYNAFSVNETIRASVDRYFRAQYFGNVIQLSDLLSVIHAVPGVDNVRWSSDVPGSIDTNRVYETNRVGEPRPGITYSNDFFLSDNELPALAEAISYADQTNADYLRFAVQPGLVIRARAQNTWIQS